MTEQIGMTSKIWNTIWNLTQVRQLIVSIVIWRLNSLVRGVNRHCLVYIVVTMKVGLMGWMSKAMEMSRWWDTRRTTTRIIATGTEFTCPLVGWWSWWNGWWNCLKRLLIMNWVWWMGTIFDGSQVTVSLVPACIWGRGKGEKGKRIWETGSKAITRSVWK